MISPLWESQQFKETAILILSVLAFLGIILFPFRHKNSSFLKAWHSLQSWLIGAPILFILIGSGGIWPMAGLVLCSIFATKEFFQMTGMYHRNAFVWLTYLSLMAMGFCIVKNERVIYNFIPMLSLGLMCLLPIIHNEARNMIQYTAISFLACNLLGWAFLHLGWLMIGENGAFSAIYLILLTEVCDNTALGVSKVIGKHKILENIASNRTIEGIVVCIITTILVGWGMRHLLPDRSTKYWFTISLVAIVVGGLGGVVLSWIRRDLGMRDTGAFIIGRGGILDRIERLIFAAPALYFVLHYLDKMLIYLSFQL